MLPDENRRDDFILFLLFASLHFVRNEMRIKRSMPNWTAVQRTLV